MCIFSCMHTWVFLDAHVCGSQRTISEVSPWVPSTLVFVVVVVVILLFFNFICLGALPAWMSVYRIHA